jgi:hypothetical protein
MLAETWPYAQLIQNHTMNTYGEELLEISGQPHAPAALFPKKQHPVPILQKSGQASQWVSTP